MFFANDQIGFYAEKIGILVGLIIILVTIYLIIYNIFYLVDRVVDVRGHVTFDIYIRKNGIFLVKDYTGIKTKKLYFKRFVDVEAYVFRKVNRWNK